MKSQAQRKADYDRMLVELGVDRIGIGPDALPLPPRAGSGTRARGAALPIEGEIYGVQMQEFAEIWPRPGLDLRTRAFVTVATLSAIAIGDTLYRHVNIALNLGITPEELHEVFLHTSCYAGYAKWDYAMAIANEVFVARGILPAGSGVTVDPQPPMTPEQRVAASQRIGAALNVGRIGLDPDGPRLKALPGGPVLANKPGSLGEELAMIGNYYGYGEIWGRPGLPLRIRSFVTCAILQSMVENHQLHIHLANAMNIGITPEEMQEALVQVGVYHGVSGWHNAITVARHVFEQQPQAQQASPVPA